MLLSVQVTFGSLRLRGLTASSHTLPAILVRSDVVTSSVLVFVVEDEELIRDLLEGALSRNTVKRYRGSTEDPNANPKPFRWVRSADDVLTAIERFCTYNTSTT